MLDYFNEMEVDITILTETWLKESKQIRDAVKASAANLANHRDTAGMRLHVPDHLQRDFRALMNLSFDLKK